MTVLVELLLGQHFAVAIPSEGVPGSSQAREICGVRCRELDRSAFAGDSRRSTTQKTDQELSFGTLSHIHLTQVPQEISQSAHNAAKPSNLGIGAATASLCVFLWLRCNAEVHRCHGQSML